MVYQFCSYFLLLISLLAPQLKAQDLNISNGQIFDGEPYLAMNPNNPDHLVVAWMGFDQRGQLAIKTRVSKDGGQSWSIRQKLPHEQSDFSSADPTMAFDDSGHVYLVYIDFLRNQDSGAVYIRKSVDDGFNWQEAQEVTNAKDEPGRAPIDRPWMAIDRTNGPRKGHIYITTMNTKGANTPYHAYFHRSRNGGSSWEPSQYLDSGSWRVGDQIKKPMPTPVVTTDGTFHAVFPSYVPSQDPLPRYILATSANGGQSFTYQTMFRQRNPFNNPVAKKGYLLRADPTDAKHLVFLYFATPHGDADLLMRESFDEGQTWSDPVRVNDDPKGNNRMQDMVWANFNRNGDLAVCWRDRRDAPDSSYRTSSAIWGAVKQKDSNEFSANFRISGQEAAYDSVLDGEGNDFMSLAFESDTLYVVWGDTRNGTLQIWFRKMNASSGNTAIVKNLARPQDGINLYPNPAEKQVCIGGTAMQQIQVLDAKGRLTYNKQNFTKKDKVTISTSHWNKGVYVVKILTESGWVSRRLVKH